MAGLSDGWMDVFRAGNYGDKGQWAPADLDQIAADYSAAIHEAPVVIGHPEHDHPAYAWVDGLRVRRNGGAVLQARLKQVEPGFEQMVKDGRFKQRSVALYTRFDKTGRPYLRHLGFLGAAPPEVKGLKPIQFGDAEHIEFAVTLEERTMPEEKDKKEPGVAERFFDHVRQFFGGDKPAGASFTEDQLNQRLADQAQTLAQQFNDQMASLKKEVSEASQASNKKVAELSDRERDREIEAFWIEGLKQGRLLPAFEEAFGLKTLLKRLAASPAELAFTEKQDGKDVEVKRTGAEALMRFLDELPKTVRFDHITRKARAAAARGERVVQFKQSGTREFAGIEKDQRVKALIAESKTKNPDRPLTYAEGLQLVNEQDAAEGAGQEA